MQRLQCMSSLEDIINDQRVRCRLEQQGLLQRVAEGHCQAKTSSRHAEHS